MALLCYAMLLCPEAPIDRAPHSSVPWAVVGYALYALTVGLHSLAFSKCIALLGIVPTAVATGGVQQAAQGAGGDWAMRTGQRRILVWAAEEETAAPVAATKPAVRADKPAKTAHGRVTAPPVREPQILVYARNLATGDLVSASDLVWSDAGALPVALDAPSDPAQAIGKVLRRPVRAGASVNGADLAQARVIRRDDLVSVDYQADGVSLTLEGKALSDACVGDTLQVLNPQSKKIIEAVASGPDRAVVGPTAEALKAAAFNRPHSYAVR